MTTLPPGQFPAAAAPEAAQRWDPVAIITAVVWALSVLASIPLDLMVVAESLKPHPNLGWGGIMLLVVNGPLALLACVGCGIMVTGRMAAQEIQPSVKAHPGLLACVFITGVVVAILVWGWSMPASGC